MTTAIFGHEDFTRHVTPPGHPECAERLDAVNAALAAARFGGLRRETAPKAERADLLLCHPGTYVDMVEAEAPAEGWSALDPDTHMSPGSLDAALRAVGGNLAAVDLVLGGAVANAFVACRPPGHHAERSRAMGFCIFGNAAIGAMHALERHGLERVAIIDFDVHHGNGTQDLLWNEERVLFCSTHQMPLYPGTGSASERGAFDNVLNVPLAPMTGGAEMRRAYDTMILPAVVDFAPQLVIVSAGFDAHAADPLANLTWNEDDFAWVTGRICDVAQECCDGRVVSTLEGGYDLNALGRSVAAHVGILMERGA